MVLYLCNLSEDDVQGRDRYLVKILLVACKNKKKIKKVSSLMATDVFCMILFLSCRCQPTPSANACSLSHHGGGKHSQMAEEGR